MGNNNELKMVKNARLESSGDFVKIVHYHTVIFTYNQKTKRAWSLKNCSQTSNRQIIKAERFFNVQPGNYTQVMNEERMGFSGAYQN